jgi:hypothetical protein
MALFEMGGGLPFEGPVDLLYELHAFGTTDAGKVLHFAVDYVFDQLEVL